MKPRVLSGSLSYQIEHHLFRNLPAHRHAEIAAAVREINPVNAWAATLILAVGLDLARAGGLPRRDG